MLEVFLLRLINTYTDIEMLEIFQCYSNVHLYLLGFQARMNICFTTGMLSDRSKWITRIYDNVKFKPFRIPVEFILPIQWKHII